MKKIITLKNLFLLIIFCLPLYLVRATLFGVPTNVLELLALIAIVFTVVKERALLLEEISGLPVIFKISCVLILTGVLLSIIANDNQLAGFGIFKGWFLVPMFFSFALYATLESRWDVEKIFASLYFSSAFIGFIAIIYRFADIVTYDNRLSAFYLSPNYLAMYLVPGAIFGFHFLLKSFSQNNFSRKIVFHFALLMIILIPLYYTYSYGAWTALFISLLAILFLSIPLNKKLLLSTLFLILFFIIMIVSQLHASKFSELTNFSSRSSLASRQTIWQVSWLLIKENPVAGIGPGNFQPAYLTQQPKFAPYLEWAVPQPHNIFLAFWLQTGLFGLIGFLILLSFVFHVLWNIFKNKKGAILIAPLFSFFLYIVLHGLIDTTYWKNDLSFLFWICTFLILFNKKQSLLSTK